MLKHIFTLIWNKKRSNFLLFLEIFIAFLILYIVFTFVVANMRKYSEPLGFNTKDTWIIMLSFDRDDDSATIVGMKERLYSELLAKPEIASASYTSWMIPFSGYTSRSSGTMDNGIEYSTDYIEADENYLETAELKLVEGRWFNEDDRFDKYKPVVINKALYDESFKGRNLKDSLYQIHTGENDYNRIIGVVENYKYHGEFSINRGVTFLLTEPHPRNSPRLHIRLNGKVSPMFEKEVSDLVSSITKRKDFTIRNLENDRIKNSRKKWVPIVGVLSISGFLVINVALGLFGVLWYNINKRRAEIGLRRTLGATQAEISKQFIGEILLVTFLGILVGLFFAIQLPWMKVFEMENIDYYYSMLISGGLILILVLICAFYPSRQAARIHPALALHEE